MECELFYAEPLIELDIQDIIKTTLELSPKRIITINSVVAAATHNQMFVVRNEGERIIAVTTLVPIFLAGKEYGSVQDVSVCKKYRGRGIGKILMKKVVWYAKESGMSLLDLTTRSTDGAAVRLYEGIGFKKRDTNVYRLTF